MENTQDQNSYEQYQEYLKQPLSVGDWFIVILITSIPLVGIIMLLVWAFSSNTNVNKANWAKATLLWMVLWGVLALLLFGIMGASFMHALT